MAGTTVQLYRVGDRTNALPYQCAVQINKIIADLEKLRAGGGALIGSATYDPASLADGVGATTTVTVTGAALGDFVTGVSFSLDLQGIGLTAYVSATNTVAVRFQNESTATVDLASGTIRVRVSPAGTFAGAASDMTAALLAYPGTTAIA